MMYTVCYNDSGFDQLAMCKSWWQGFIAKGKEGVNQDGWTEEDYVNEINRRLLQENVTFDRKSKNLTFMSESHFHWFVLRWS